MSFVRVWLHAVWGTKNRHHFLTPEIRKVVMNHIKSNAKIKGIYIDRINGHTEHLHCLMSLNADITIAKTMQLIKGESAYWINKEKIVPDKFEWADAYYVNSVSESLLGIVRRYIDNQEEHHRKKTVAEEYESLLSTYKFPDKAE